MAKRYKKYKKIHNFSQTPFRQKSQKNQVFKFFLKYVLFMAIGLFLISFEPLKRLIDLNGLYTKGVVKITSFVLNLFNVVNEVRGTVLVLKGLAMDVRFGCNGLEAFMIYAVAILAFPASKKDKLMGILIGFLVLQVINIIRIISLGIIGIYWSSFFHCFHIYVAQGIMIAIALLLFMIWLDYARPKN